MKSARELSPPGDKVPEMLMKGISLRHLWSCPGIGLPNPILDFPIEHEIQTRILLI